jgi:hypothetical protein
MSDKDYLTLSDDQRLTIGSLLTTLKGLGIVRNETDFRGFIMGCFYRGLYEYKKDLSRDDC